MTRVLFFGRLREVAETGERLIDLPAGIETGGDLIELLGAQDQALRAALMEPTVRIVADDAIVARGASIVGAHEIAFLPPVSGG